MESTTNVLGLVLVFVVTLILAALVGRRGRRPNLPPGPRPWPVIGNLNLIGPLPHRTFHDLSRKYGPLMYLKLGSFGCVVGSSAETAKAFLKTHDLVSAGRPKTAAGKLTAYNYSDITWAPYGAHWRQARKMCMLELFSVRRLDSFAYIREEETKAMLRGVFERCSRSSDHVDVPINLKDVLSTVSLNVITRMVLGKKYADEHESDPKGVMSPGEFKEVLDELFLLNGVLNVGDSIPSLGFLDLQGYEKRMKVASKKFDGFLEHVLEEHARRRSGVRDYVARDMVDVLLQLAEDPGLEIKLERNGVKAFTLDLIAGGTESSAVTVEWAIAELLRKPEIFEKASEELERVIGGERWVEEKDIVNLPYIDSIVKETLRLHPVAPMLVPRCSRDDIKINGYDIPKGTRILVNTWTIGRDPTLWNNPEEFMPERFIGKSIDVKGHDFELLPFGSGRRMCPGHSLGLKVIQSTLANLLHGFTWKLPSNMKPEDLDMDEIFGLSTPKKFPLVTVPEPRLSTSVYYI